MAKSLTNLRLKRQLTLALVTRLCWLLVSDALVKNHFAAFANVLNWNGL